MMSAVLAGVIGLFVPSALEAQARWSFPTNRAEEQGAFTDASFGAAFRKYTAPENTFSPFYSWDAHMALNVTVFRKSSSAVSLTSVFQTVGTENLGAKVSVGGTGYLLRVGYVRTHSADFHTSVGLAHFSSHLTRDLDDKLDEERRAGHTIPIVADPHEYNVFFFEAHRKFSAYPLTPEVAVLLEPMNFVGDSLRYVRPVYVGTRWTLWRGSQTAVVAETQHEIGTNPVNDFSLSLELYATDQDEGRLQMFISASPGNGMHVSPNIGALRDGLAFGIRMVFGA